MRNLLWVFILPVVFPVTVPLFAQADDVILNPGTLSGSVSVVGRSITSITVHAIDTVKLYSATTTIDVQTAADSVDYVLTVEGDRDYYVMAEAVVSGTHYIKALLPVTGPFNVPIGDDVPLDMSMEPAIVSGTISSGSSSNTIESYSIYAYVTLPEFDGSSYSYYNRTYASNVSVPGDKGTNYTLLLAPGVECNVYAYIGVDGLAYQFYDYDTIAPAAGAVANRDYVIDVTAASISGTALLQGIDVASTSVRGYASSPSRNNSCMISNASTGLYTLEVDAGAWRLSPYFTFDLSGDLSNLSGSLRLPYTAGMDIQAGDQLTAVDFIVDPGFIPGTLNLWGANTNFSSARVGARELPGYGYVYSQVAPETGEFMFVCSPGDWRRDYYQYLSFDYPDDSDASLRSTMRQYEYSNADLQIVGAGQIAPSVELTYGTITVRRYFYVAGDGMLSQPYIEATKLNGYNSKAYGYGSDSLTTEGQAIVTLLLPGTYTIEAFAYVNGSNTEFGTVDITVDEGDVVVIGGTYRPTIKVTNPTSGETICDDKVTVEGTVTDDFGIASIVINGEFVAFDAAENGAQFSHEISLDEGENLITIVVADTDGTDPVVLTMIVTRDVCEQTLTITSGSGGSVVGPGEGEFTYDSGESVAVSAVPDDCYEFIGWTGTAVDAGKVGDATDPNTTVVLDDDYTLQADFKLIHGTLTITSTEGGSVTVPGEGILEYECGTQVPIEAQAEACYRFVGWTGTAVDAGKVGGAADPNTSVVLDDDYTLQANFELITHGLTVGSTKGGSVSKPGEGIIEYSCGVSVSIEAVPDDHAEFTGWSGTAVDHGKVADPDSRATTVTVDGDYTIQANFTIQQHTVSIFASDGGSASLTAQVGSTSTSWLAEKTLQFDHGTKIFVTATAESGYEFSHWSGAIGSTASYLFFPVDQDYDLTANFIAITEP